MELDDNILNKLDIKKLNIKDLSLLFKLIHELDTNETEDIEVI